MREVQLTRGMVALVDDEEFERVSQLRWYPFRPRNVWYALATNVKRPDGSYTTISLHRFILRLPPGRVPQVDHIDGVGLNCQKENMRLVTYPQNAQNRGASSNSKTGIRGVCFATRQGRYIAQVCVNGQNTYLGSFTDIVAAEQAAIAGRRKYMTHAPECERTATA